MLIAHVGLPKAASTFLQRAIFSQHTDICYLGKNFTDPELDRAGRFITRRNSLRYNARSVIAAFRNKIATSNRPVALYSEEDLSSCKFVDVATMISRLQAIDSELRYLIIIRNQIDWLQSLYFFYLMTLRREVMGGFETWIKEQLPLLGGIGGSLGQLLINPVIQAFEGDFGPERVTVLPFEMLKSAPSEFCDRISLSLGIDAAQTRRLHADAGHSRVNKARISQPLADFLLLLRYQLEGDRSRFFTEVDRWLQDVRPQSASRGGDVLKKVEQALREGLWGYDAWAELFRVMSPIIDASITGPPAQAEMSDELRNRIEQRARAHNRAIALRYNLDLGGFGYPMPSHQARELPLKHRSNRALHRKESQAVQ